MANIEDYLDWRSDVPFSVSPFNEVDNLILSELVYSAFDGIVPGPGVKEKISLEEACRLFFEKFDDETIISQTTMTKMAPFLMRKMAGSPRYKGTKLCGFVNELEQESQSQFAAISYYLPDGSIYACFRGTDDTLIGWREDFNMCFSAGTGGQLKAVEYLNDNFSRTMRPIRVGGHSKGGNFAVYASAFCRSSVKDNIVEVYSNDGPGFIDEIVNTSEYKSIIKRIKSIIPEQSVVGLLMCNKFTSKIIKSEAKGINQHDPLSWQVLGNHFVEADSLNGISIMIDETLKQWVVGVDYETRNLFGEIVFSALSSSGATRLSQVTGGGVRSMAALTKEYQALDKEQQQFISEILMKLVGAGGETVKNSFVDKLTKLVKTEKNKEK